MSELIIIGVIVLVAFVTVTAILGRYKRCPSDKILVIYGLTGKKASGESFSAKCIHGG
ncbi:MAG: flotillin family protein, partial [Fimbriimonadaceae bacterium]|nr:flotillin family protein [Chitinophagales bacterium]